MGNFINKVSTNIKKIFKCDKKKSGITNKKKCKKKLKHYIFVIIFLCLLLVFAGGRFIPTLFVSSIHNISDLNGNLDSIKSGDIIDYEINGYSDWKVLSVDRKNGIVDVTSSSNIYDLTMEPYKTVDEYNTIFQTEANKFYDNKYVINARTINKSDVLMFNDTSNEEYWLANVNENTLMTNKIGNDDDESDDSKAIWTKSTLSMNEIYVVPYIGINIYENYPYVGQKMDLSFNGIDHWFYSGQTIDDAYIYLPEAPVPLAVDSTDDIGRVSQEYFESFESVSAPMIAKRGNWLNKFSHNFHGLILLYEGQNFFHNKDGKVMYFVAEAGREITTEDGKYSIKKTYGSKPGTIRYYDDGTGRSGYSYIDESEIFVLDTSHVSSSKPSKDVSVFYEPKTLTFGYRPVLTLKVGNASSGKNIDDSLDVGNYVNYEANGYSNWRVLSVNEDAGTVDIISGGIVKNLSLYGKNDYDNYENILQREVDAYKNGDIAISARAVQESDIDLLDDINDRVKSMYWYNRKTQRRLDAFENIQTSTIYDELSYDVGVLAAYDYNANHADSIMSYWVPLYSCVGTVYDTNHIEEYMGPGDLNYIAGLRPIITLKYENVEYLSEDNTQRVITKYEDDDNYYFNEQASNNKSLPVAIDSDKSQLRNLVLDIGKFNIVLKWLIILTFIYGVFFAVAITFIVLHMIRNEYTN